MPGGILSHVTHGKYNEDVAINCAEFLPRFQGFTDRSHSLYTSNSTSIQRVTRTRLRRVRVRVRVQ